MLTIKLELNSAITGKTTEIGKAIIYNDATGSSEVGNYQYKLAQDGKIIATGEIKDFPRLEKRAWDLVQIMLNDSEELRVKFGSKPVS